MASVKDICRICLQETDYDEIHDIDLVKLGYFTNSCILRGLDLELFQNHIICDTCIYNLRTLKTIRKYVNRGNEEVKKQRNNRRKHRYIDIRPQSKFLNTEDDLAFCRLCFQPTKHIAIYLWNNQRNIVPLKYIIMMLKYVDLSMDLLQQTIRPILCYQCWQRVQVAFSFRKRIDVVTDKCNHYLRLLRKSYLDREDLQDILHMWNDLGSYNTETVPTESESSIPTQQSPDDESTALETMPQLLPEYICTEEHNYFAKKPRDKSPSLTNSDTISVVEVDNFDMPILTPCINEDAKELKKVNLLEDRCQQIARTKDPLEFDESVLDLKTPKRKTCKKKYESLKRVTRQSSLKEDPREYSSNDLLVLTKEEVIKKPPVRNRKRIFPISASILTTNKVPPKDIPSTQSHLKQSSSDYTIERLNFDNEVQPDTENDNLKKKKPGKNSKLLHPKHTSNDSPKNNAPPLKPSSSEYTFERLNFDNEVQSDTENDNLKKKKRGKNSKLLHPKLTSSDSSKNNEPPLTPSSSEYTFERLNFDNEVQRDTEDDNLKKKKLGKNSKLLHPKHTSSDSSKNNAPPLKPSSSEYTFERLNFDNEVQFDREAVEEEEIEIKREIVSDSDDAFIETSAGFANDSDDDLPEQCPNLDVFIKTEPTEIIDEEENEPPQLEFQGPCVYDPKFTIYNTFSVNDKRNLISLDEKRNLLNVSNESPALETGDPMEVIKKGAASAQQNGFYNDKMTQKPPTLKIEHGSAADFKPKEVSINLPKCDLPSTSQPAFRPEFYSMPNIINNPQQTGKIQIKSIQTLVHPKFYQEKTGKSIPASSNIDKKPQQEAPPIPIKTVKTLLPAVPKSDQSVSVASIIGTKSVPKDINTRLPVSPKFDHTKSIPAGIYNNPPKKPKRKSIRKLRVRREKNYSFRENTKICSKLESRVHKGLYWKVNHFYKELDYLTISEAVPYECRMCYFKTIKRGVAQKHVALHFTKSSYLHVCNTCYFRTTNKHSLKVHIESNHATTTDPNYPDHSRDTSAASLQLPASTPLTKTKDPPTHKCGYCRKRTPQMQCPTCGHFFHAKCLLFDQDKQLFKCSHFRVLGCITILKTFYRYTPCNSESIRVVCNYCAKKTKAWVNCRRCNNYFHFNCFNYSKTVPRFQCSHLVGKDIHVNSTNEVSLIKEQRTCDFCSGALKSYIPCPNCLKFMHQFCFLKDSKEMRFNCKHADIIGEVSSDYQKAIKPMTSTSEQAENDVVDLTDFIMLCD